MQNRKEIQNQVLSLFFDNSRKFSISQKETICEQLSISIFELDRILDNYYANLEKFNVFRLSWTQTHPNSYTLPSKTSFIDAVVKSEHEKLLKTQLKEKRCFEGGVAV
jgi:hypothetical protein